MRWALEADELQTLAIQPNPRVELWWEQLGAGELALSISHAGEWSEESSHRAPVAASLLEQTGGIVRKAKLSSLT